jgi:hypothetical protein
MLSVMCNTSLQPVLIDKTLSMLCSLTSIERHELSLHTFGNWFYKHPLGKTLIDSRHFNDLCRPNRERMVFRCCHLLSGTCLIANHLSPHATWYDILEILARQPLKDTSSSVYLQFVLSGGELQPLYTAALWAAGFECVTGSAVECPLQAALLDQLKAVLPATLLESDRHANPTFSQLNTLTACFLNTHLKAANIKY